MPFIFKLTISDTSLFHDSVKSAMRYALAALHALCGVDIVRAFYLARNRVRGAVALTQRTAAAFVGFYVVTEQGFAHARRALLRVNMLHVFVAEMLHCRKHGVGRGLSERAQRRAFHVFCELGYLIEVLGFALALGDFG